MEMLSLNTHPNIMYSSFLEKDKLDILIVILIIFFRDLFSNVSQSVLC